MLVPNGKRTGRGGGGGKPKAYKVSFPDPIRTFHEPFIRPDGMLIDREMYGSNFESRIRSDEYIRTEMGAGNWDHVIHYVGPIFLKTRRKLYAGKITESLQS